MFTVPELYRVKTGVMGSTKAYGNNGAFFVPMIDKSHTVLKVIASDQDGWEHVSVSHSTRTPTWEEMCRIKGLFWGPEDCVIQYHPPKSEYVNVHPTCLHMWRPVGAAVPVPPSWMVGPV